MRFPKEQMRILTTFDGRESEHGWLELNLKTVDLEGAGKLVVNLDDLEDLKAARTRESDALANARKLLGGD